MKSSFDFNEQRWILILTFGNDNDRWWQCWRCWWLWWLWPWKPLARPPSWRWTEGSFLVGEPVWSLLLLMIIIDHTHYQEQDMTFSPQRVSHSGRPDRRPVGGENSWEKNPKIKLFAVMVSFKRHIMLNRYTAWIEWKDTFRCFLLLTWHSCPGSPHRKQL